MRMFHAAWAASQRPAFSPTRGSGVGAVAETIGSTGRGMTGGGGGGGGGGVPRPPPPAVAPPAGISGEAGVAAAGAAAAGGVLVGGAAAGAGVPGVAAGGGVLGAAAGGAAVLAELAHAATPRAPAANAPANRLPINRDEGRGRDNLDIIGVGSFLIGTAAAREHLGHAIDLNRLIGVDIRREFENRLVLRRTVRLEQHVDHVDRA